MLEMPQNRVESRGQTGQTPLACGSLAFAAGPPVVAQALVVAVQVLLQARGHLLVTGTQLPFAPAPFVSCGQKKQEGTAQCLSLPETALGVQKGP